MTVPFTFDVFLSHSSKDSAVVLALAGRLQADGIRVWLNDWEIRPGDSIPADLVTTSASGLDPDISPAAALFQIPRIAKARKISKDKLRQLVEENTAGRLWGILGEPHVNVLRLNMSLDTRYPAAANRKP